MAKSDLMALLKEAGFRGQGLANAYAIAIAESGGRARAHNPNASTGDNSYGLFQINMLGKMGPARRKQYGLSSNDDLFDPLTNAKIAFKMSHGGTNFKPWTTFTSGKYKDFLGQSGAQVSGAQMSSSKSAQATPQTTAEEYGYVKAFLKAHPDVAAVVRQAVTAGYSQQRFQAEVKGTKWWQSRTDSQRKWDVLSTENPGEAKRQLAEARTQILQQSARLGIQLEKGDADRYAKQFIVNGATDAEQAAVLAKEFSLPGAEHALTGTASEADAQLSATAAAYGISLSTGTHQSYIRKVLAGTMDVGGFEDIMREQAKTLYPPIAKQLDSGMTVSQYLNPFMEIASRELGVPTAAMSTTDPKWTKALTGVKGVPMDSDEWTKTIRNDPTYRWNETLNAKQQAASLGAEMSKLMGSLA